MAQPKCRGTNRAGEPCGLWPMRGGFVCASHGGKAPQVKAAAAARLVEWEAEEAVGRLQLRTGPVDNPLVALQRLAGELLDVKDWIRGAVTRLQDDELRTRDEKGGEQVRAELTAYMAILNQCVNGLAQLGKLKIDERLAAITEEQKRMMLRALEAALVSAGVIGPDQTAAKQVFASKLRLVASEGKRVA